MGKKHTPKSKNITVQDAEQQFLKELDDKLGKGYALNRAKVPFDQIF